MKEIKGVEIFGEGVWNGNKISSSVLKDIVKGFEATKEFIKPVLKLGHDNNQKLLQSDGFPAAGWVDNVYIQGKKLFADFSDIPDKIYQLIQKKAYRKVSVEIFSGYTFDNKTFPNLLGAVALLGADTPAVLSLNDILAQYKIDGSKIAQGQDLDNMELKIYTQNLEDDMADKTPELNPNVELEKKLDAYSKQLAEAVDTNKKTLEANQHLKSEFDAYKKASEEKIATLDAQKTEADIEKFTLSLEGQSLLSPSMKPYAKALLSLTKQEFSVGEKKLSVFETVEELLKIAKEAYKVNLKEVTTKTKDAEKVSNLDEKIQSYAKEKGVDYAEAYKQVMKKTA